MITQLNVYWIPKSICIMYDIDEIQNTRGLHMAHWNARSIVNKWDNIKANFANGDIHMLSFSETWLQRNLPDNLFNLGSDYTLIRLDRGWNDSNDPNAVPKKGGGLCTFIKNSLEFSETAFDHMNISNNNIEIQWISINQKPNKTILIGNCYRPPQGKKPIEQKNQLEQIDLDKRK